MEKAMICFGIWFMIVGLTISCFSLYASYYFSWACLTEFLPGMLAFIIGVHMLNISRKSNSKPESEITDSNRESPFYYELEPSLPPRSLPPIPRDIGRDYDPIIQDKV